MALNAAYNERLKSREYLLANFVRTVGVVLDINSFKQSVFVLWSGVNHIHVRVKAILRHGAKIKHHLIFAQPSFAAFDVWLESKILDHSLAGELVKCREDISEFYYEWALFQDKNLFNKFLDTLRVLGTRDLELFCDIELATNEIVRTFASARKMDSTKRDLEEKVPGTSTDEKLNPSEPSTLNDVEPVTLVLTDTEDTSSASNLSIPNFSYAHVSPVPSPPEFSHMAGLDFSETNDKSSGSLKVVRASPIKTKSSFSEPLYENRNSILSIIDKSNEETVRKAPKSLGFLESGGFVLPPALGNFPLPQKGQSLTSFLSSLSGSMPDLDRENAHFNVSEALISAFERLKVNQTCRRRSPDSAIIPDEMEDMFGTVGSIEGRKQKLAEPESTRKFYSGKRFPRPPILNTETEESELEYWKQRPRRPPAHIRKKPRSGKLIGSDGQSFLSTTEISSSSSETGSEDDIASSSFSAENVALNLLRNAKMKEKHLPPASDLRWLVSESEAPQTLLPMPKNWATSASESDSDRTLRTDMVGVLDHSMRLRGTCDWAPPRPQIIFTVHPPPTRNILTDIQRYRCAGCGMRVDKKYASTFRYCFYLGRYFCTGCHTGKKARLPQLILHKWDFSPYLVSNFSATLLESLQSDPLYNAFAINPSLSKKVKLNNFRNYRIQLGFLHEYLKNCKSAETLYRDYLKFPTYYTADVDLCSLEDMCSVRFSTGMPMFLKDFVAHATYHVLNCGLCRHLGFVCEICPRKEVIFSFQIKIISRCPKCNSCFHLKCFNPTIDNCPKCLRVKRRNTLEVSPASIAV